MIRKINEKSVDRAHAVLVQNRRSTIYDNFILLGYGLEADVTAVSASTHQIIEATEALVKTLSLTMESLDKTEKALLRDELRGILFDISELIQ